jgi:iron complex outermembrane receptor protein
MHSNYISRPADPAAPEEGRVKGLQLNVSAVALLAAIEVAVLLAPATARAASEPVQAAAVANAAALETVIVTARRREENLQTVPGGVSVVGGATLDKTSIYNTQQITQLIPSLNYSSPNPRNTAFTIRGLGSSVVAVSQANDGLEPGVGFYVDQVYHARPATAAFDFLDVERVEVLRGPQGTLFGKNTTAGAINIVSKSASFDPELMVEGTAGNLNYFQGKASINGPIVDDKLAARVSIAATRRDGVIDNVTTGVKDNNVRTLGLRGQLLYQPSSNFSLKLTADYSRFDSLCCTQVYLTVGTTLKPLARQFAALAAGHNYTPASTNPFDRKTDIDANLGVDTNEGGVSAIADWNLGAATITSVTAWRWWNWDAANDRDYTSEKVQLLQHIPSRQDQYSQELRIASNGKNLIDYVAGLYWFSQTIKGEPITGYGPDAAYWLLGPPPATPANLLDGYTTDGSTKFISNSYAAFGEATLNATDKLSATLGLRYTQEDKSGRYDSFVLGGLATTNATLINQKLSILRPQSYRAKDSDGSLSGRGNLSYRFTDDLMVYASYARGSKSGGINMSGLPLNAANLPALSTVVVRPEKNTTYEVGVKAQLFDRRLTLNLDAFDTVVHDFQTNVVDTGPGALRAYLANIEKVEVKGFELDSAFVIAPGLTGHASATYSDGTYVSYRNGPCPLELIAASTTVCDLSGRPVTGLPRWVTSIGGEYAHDLTLGGVAGQAYLRAEFVSRSSQFGDPSDSQYTRIEGYSVVNANLGFRQNGPVEVFVWVKNLFDKDYIQNVTVQAGNSGLVVGTPSDPRTVGVTLRAKF